LPAPHLEQLACPVSAVYWPFEQWLHSVAPDFDILPILHGSQTLLFDAPVIVPFDPGGHRLQVLMLDAPIAVEYVPLPHALQSNDDKLPVVSLHVPDSHG